MIKSMAAWNVPRPKLTTIAPAMSPIPKKKNGKAATLTWDQIGETKQLVRIDINNFVICIRYGESTDFTGKKCIFTSKKNMLLNNYSFILKFH